MLLKDNKKLQGETISSLYLPTESIQNHYMYDCKGDIWCCGIIMHILLVGEFPFCSKENNLQDSKAGKDTLTINNSLFDNFSQDCIKLLHNMLNFDPMERINAQEGLEDIWIVNFTNKLVFEGKILKESLKNLHKFNSQINFQRAALSVIAKRLMKQDTEKKLREIFKLIDVNNDGQLSKEELIEGYKILTQDEELARKKV